ncbi:MAG: NAD-dependent epimerase/dehydratase family protein [Sedimentisphaerales bacterium]|nr:NAD-dependent epimerase/dehydratase family protein [Sedimentisphaerales bacterium]
MKNDRLIIAITCIGSGVGQSIINSCRMSRLPIQTVGLGNNPFAHGAYDCDFYDYLPSIYSEHYIDELIKKYHKYNADLVIPGLDDEAFLLSKSIEELKNNGIKAVVAGAELLRLCRDKAAMSTELNRVSDIFVKSYPKADIETKLKNGDIKFPLIAKPVGGFGSRGIKIIKGYADLNIVESEYVIQELAVPGNTDPNRDLYLNQIDRNINPQVSEISIQLVSNEKGAILGQMASYNKLNNGVPIEIVPIENKYVWNEIDKLIPTFQKLGMRGPLNIQGRLTNNGLKLFEMNARFTGITGLRALMGFNEVEACIKEWLNIESGHNSLQLNYDRFGVRQVADKAISIQRNEKVKELSIFLNKTQIKIKPTLLITGAGGYLGRNLIKKLAEMEKYEVYALDIDKSSIQSLFSSINGVKCFDLLDIRTGHLSLGLVDTMIHCAFARPHRSDQEIAESLQFTNEIIMQATMNQIQAIINISSQSVYGLSREPLWTEDLPAAPETVYAQAKHASEIITTNANKINKQTCTTSLRMAALSGGQEGLLANDCLSKFVLQALKGETIKIVGGNQRLEWLDVRDAVNSIIFCLKTNPHDWKPIYNVGTGKSYNIIDIGKITLDIASKYDCTDISKIVTEPKDIRMKFGMDNNRFKNDFGWSASYDIPDIIDSLFKYLTKVYYQ